MHLWQCKDDSTLFSHQKVPDSLLLIGDLYEPRGSQKELMEKWIYTSGPVKALSKFHLVQLLIRACLLWERVNVKSPALVSSVGLHMRVSREDTPWSGENLIFSGKDR